MLKDGLASWSAAEAITCCGKPAKESTVHPWCELWEDLTFTSPKNTFQLTVYHIDVILVVLDVTPSHCLSIPGVQVLGQAHPYG